MGFRQGAFAKVWSANNNGNYSTCNLTVSRKKKDSDEYEVVFKDGFVRFVGKAHEKISGMNIPEKVGVSIKIVSCDVENRYDTNTKKLYTNYTIYEFEQPDSSGGGSGGSSGNKPSAQLKAKQESKQQNDTDEELPF